MALRNILQEGDPALTKVSRAVTNFDQRLHILLDDMRETLLEANGVGLAAPQVGVLRRVVLVVDTSIESEDVSAQIIELINPEIIASEGEQEGPEGCLSLPGVMGIVKRPDSCTVKAQDRHGNWFQVEGHGLTARAFCHELDHLEGTLFTAYTDELFEVGDFDEDLNDDPETTDGE